MFEITYKDKERLNEYIENRKAYPNAVYDFTFENRFLVYHCEMTNELHYIALDMETGCGSEMCRRKKNSPTLTLPTRGGKPDDIRHNGR